MDEQRILIELLGGSMDGTRLELPLSAVDENGKIVIDRDVVDFTAPDVDRILNFLGQGGTPTPPTRSTSLVYHFGGEGCSGEEDGFLPYARFVFEGYEA